MNPWHQTSFAPVEMGMLTQQGAVARACVTTEKAKARVAAILVTVYQDAAKVQVSDMARRDEVFWFRDEVDAIAAAMERLLVTSAILPSLRQLPTLAIQCDYKESKAMAVPIKYAKGTRRKGRQVLTTPGASAKPWLNEKKELG